MRIVEQLKVYFHGIITLKKKGKIKIIGRGIRETKVLSEEELRFNKGLDKIHKRINDG